MVKTVYILGAGMSGLVAANEFVKRGHKVVVIERLNVPGGLSRTERYDGYYIDAGPHLFHTSNPEIVAYWQKTFPGIFRTPALYGKNFFDGKFFDYPLSEESLTVLPADIREQILAELALADKALASKAKNYKEYMQAVAGPTLQKMFYEEYPEKVWGMPTTELSPNWAPQRIEIRKEKKPFHADQWSGVAEDGCGTVMEVLARLLTDAGGEIVYGTSVTGLQTNSAGAIECIETDRARYPVAADDVVVSTLPITVNARYLSVPCALEFRCVRLVNLVIKGGDPFPSDADWLYFKDRSVIFHRAGLQTRFSRKGIPDDWSILCCEIAYTPGDAISTQSDAAIEERVIADLERLGFMAQRAVVKVHHMDLGPVYPNYRVGYEIELQRVRSALEACPNFYFTGTLADYSYADFQILCAKAIDLVSLIEDKGGDFNRVKKVSRRITSFNSVVKIGRYLVGKDYSPYIIGEIGLNHNGSVDLAKKLIDMCVDAGCSAAKFQTFTSNRMSAKVLDARYSEDILELEENTHQLFSRLIFSKPELEEIFEYARKKGIEVFSTPFDVDSLELLDSLGVNAYKIASMDIVNLPLIRAVAAKGKPLIMSTGMATLGDIEEAVQAILEAGNPNLVLLHCVSSYPATASESNLRMIPRIAESFGVIPGFSDHFPDIHLVPAAIALGARVIEKHVTLDRSMKGPDHVFSLEASALKCLVNESAEVFSALGNGIKSISSGEYRSIQRLRRSVFAKVRIPEGTTITEDMLEVKSPGIGVLPKYIGLIVGRTARQTVEADHPVTWDLI